MGAAQRIHPVAKLAARAPTRRALTRAPPSPASGRGKQGLAALAGLTAKKSVRPLFRLRGRVGVGVLPRAIMSSSFRDVAEPLPDPRVRIGVLGDVADDGDGVRAGGKDFSGLFELDAADRDQRD